MRIRRQPAALSQFLPEVLEVMFVQPPLHKRARVHARRRVALEIHQVGLPVAIAAAEEMVEADFVQRRARRKRRDVAAEPAVNAVGVDDHRHGVPADEALDAPLQLAVAGIRRLLVRRDGVDVRRVERIAKRWFVHQVHCEIPTDYCATSRNTYSSPMKLLDLTLPTPEENLACDEALLDLCETDGDDGILRFWEARQHFIVLGYSNKAGTEANLPRARQYSVPVLRRCTGGGAVLQGPGCLNYSLILRILVS